MDLQLAKLELIEMLLKTQKLSVLKQIKELLENEQVETLSDKQYIEIEQRRTDFIEGKTKADTWVNVKSRIEKSIK